MFIFIKLYSLNLHIQNKIEIYLINTKIINILNSKIMMNINKD